jgi:hypothetical protein
MYNQKLVASIKANRKILREFKDTVYIPFASEYSILIKNLNTVRAVVNVFIDGEDQVPGGLVVDAGREIDLERSIKNNNLREGNRFKFIERSDAVEQHRGIGLEDGIVRIEYQFELPPVGIQSMPGYNNILRGLEKGWLQASGFGGAGGGSFPNSATYSSTSASLNNINVSATSANVAPQTFYNDAGITVAGSKSTQSFSTTYMGALDPVKHTIVLKLLGETPDNRPVQKAVTVKAKPKCVTCGKQNKAHAKFCAECGTALEIFAN